ncbi:MAG: hypothetical protein ACTHN5_18100 [Phycisphaerae bacterium]
MNWNITRQRALDLARLRFSGYFTALLALAVSTSASAATIYSIQQFGLSGSGYLRSDGLESMRVFTGNGNIIAGTSNRYTGMTSLGEDAWAYSLQTNNTVQIGLTSADYVSPTGLRDSTIWLAATGGTVVGVSLRYNSAGGSNGQDLWAYNPQTQATTLIGLFGPDYGSGAYRRNDVLHTLPTGEVIGYATRGAGSLGQDAWYYSTATNSTTFIGLTGPDYLRSDGYRSEGFGSLFPSGYVTGTTQIYRTSSGISLGQDAWIFSPSTGTVRFGLTGPGYQLVGGVSRSSAVAYVNSSGQAVGESDRYDPNVSSSKLGTDSWVYDPATGATTRIGLVGSGYENPAGVRNSLPFGLSDDGTVLGQSQRYSGFADMGTDAWIYSIASQTTTQLGLIGAGYVRSDGYRYSSCGGTGPLQTVVGYSKRYSGTTDLGQDNWIYQSATGISKQIGLTGIGYEQSNGFRSPATGPTFTPTGIVIGAANRYNGSTAIGQDPWIYNPITDKTTRIGLTGSGYEKSDGTRFGSIRFVNTTGLIAGYSNRYSSTGTSLGLDYWIYDSNSDTTYPLQFSVKSDGTSNSTVRVLTDDGLVLGDYTKYSGSLSLGNFAFAWTENSGFVDLGITVTPSLSSTGWQSLADAFYVTPTGQIAGVGLRVRDAPTSRVAYLLTPTPEPLSAALFAPTLFLLLSRRPAHQSSIRRGLIK